MAKIKETLILEDKFSATFAKFIASAEKAAGATGGLKESIGGLVPKNDQYSKSVGGVTSALKGLIGGYVGLQAVSKLVGLSDALTSAEARINMMNDGLQTTDELMDSIFRAANRSRGSYADLANMVSKLGTLAGVGEGGAFDSSSQVVAFGEQVQKMMAISGTGDAEARGAMLQLTQGMSSGVLRGDELVSVMEQVPMIAQTIAEHLGVSVGEMRELASEGLVTAGVVKDAILGATEETNEALEEMPMTWAQVWDIMSNYATKALGPVLAAISWLANNLEIVGPLVLGLGSAFAVFQVAAHWTKIAAVATGIYNGALTFLKVGYGLLRNQTMAAAIAQYTYNSALLANPITWVIMLIGALVGVLFAAVGGYNKLTGSSVSAVGLLTGGASVILAAIGNMAAGVANVFIFLRNKLYDAITAMVTGLLGKLREFAEGLEELVNKLPGVNVDLTSAIDNAIAAVDAWGESKQMDYLEYKSLKDAWNEGYDWGANLFGGDDDESGWDPPDYSPDDSQMAADVASIKKSVDMSQEDIAMMVDMATRRYINHINFSSQTPVITINGANTGNNEADRRAMADAIKNILLEQAAAGSYRMTARTY